MKQQVLLLLRGQHPAGVNTRFCVWCMEQATGIGAPALRLELSRPSCCRDALDDDATGSGGAVTGWSCAGTASGSFTVLIEGLEAGGTTTGGRLSVESDRRPDTTAEPVETGSTLSELSRGLRSAIPLQATGRVCCKVEADTAMLRRQQSRQLERSSGVSHTERAWLE